ncbi:MAG: alpha/beta fold hydrolase [Desulfobacter sp.]
MEERIVIPCRDVRLEGVFHTGDDPRNAVVITHPHPLYGGNMENPVVRTIADAYAGAGYTTLRFNFRGTDGSSGRFDNGTGEQDDVRASVAWLKSRGVHAVHLAGYSFGAWVNARVVSTGVDIEDHVMVSPPAGFISFDAVETLSDTGFIITGSSDDIAPVRDIRALIDRWQIRPQFDVLDGCDHFYTSFLPILKKRLSAYLAGLH